MKEAVKPLLAILLAITLAGCGGSPKSVARSFTENLAHGKISEAKKYATEQTGQLLDMATSMGGLPVEPEFKFIFVEQSIDGERAVVRFQESKDGNVQSVNLVRIDGEWKVHMNK